MKPTPSVGNDPVIPVHTRTTPALYCLTFVSPSLKVKRRKNNEIVGEMTKGQNISSNLPVPQSSRTQGSLADDSTAVTPPSVSSNQPSEYQVITESCEWCMETAPWTADDEEDTNTIIAAEVHPKTIHTVLNQYSSKVS